MLDAGVTMRVTADAPHDFLKMRKSYAPTNRGSRTLAQTRLCRTAKAAPMLAAAFDPFLPLERAVLERSYGTEVRGQFEYEFDVTDAARLIDEIGVPVRRSLHAHETE